MQNWYDKTTPTNGLIAVTFENVAHYSYEGYDPSKLFSDCTPEILHAEIADGMLILYTFEFVRYEPGEDLYPIMKIRADNVEVEELERYNL